MCFVGKCCLCLGYCFWVNIVDFVDVGCFGGF